ncbi:MAG TPA: glycosyltransferase [Gemmataceae bacterium]|nr:glycosyltransferase [Gemmataceae bacterium]
MDAKGEPRVVLVHDWLNGMRGGEKCLEILCRRWPGAPLFTMLYRRGAVTPIIENRAIRTSWLQNIPGIQQYYRYFLPLMPLAANSWRIPPCDVVVSFSHCVAKAAVPPAGVPHVCYCFTPMRYAWHMRESYFGGESARSWAARGRGKILMWLREWDRQTAARVTHFVAISKTVQSRIAECYHRDSVIIYPPVDTDFYCPAPLARDNFYLVLSAFAPYKRLDLAIAACNQLRRRLVVIGTGQHERRLRNLAGPTVEFLGWQPDAMIRDHLRRCRALLFPGEEDFGIVPVEAQACGAPVIAFGRGGATETVVPLGSNSPPTGLWFEEQTTDCLSAALERFERSADRMDPSVARRQALQFDARRFTERMLGFVASVIHPRQKGVRQAA